MRLAAAWCGLAAFGSGLILCAVAAGAGPALAVPLLMAAVAEFGWGASALHAGRVVMPRTATIVSAVVLAAAVTLLVARTIGIVPFLSLLALHWAIAIVAALAWRRRRGDEPRRGVPRPAARRPGVFVLALTAQALAVAAITTPALAATEPGESAVPHGVHRHH